MTPKKGVLRGRLALIGGRLGVGVRRVANGAVRAERSSRDGAGEVTTIASIPLFMQVSRALDGSARPGGAAGGGVSGGVLTIMGGCFWGFRGLGVWGVGGQAPVSKRGPHGLRPSSCAACQGSEKAMMSIGAGMDSSLSFSLHATVRRYEDADKVAAISATCPRGLPLSSCASSARCSVDHRQREVDP
jgi:hypothetical protein